MSTAHVYSANILSVKWLKSVKIASFVPKLSSEKWPVCQGQLEGKWKKLAVVFPITTSHRHGCLQGQLYVNRRQ